MTQRPVTIQEDASVDEALQLMRNENIRRLPVVNNKGKLVGIVSELDLLKVSPSPATSLSIYEIPYLLSKLKMRDVMTKEVITVDEDTTLEEAARIMADNKIGGLPVVQGDNLVGIITETDMFKIFLEMFGARESGVRLSMLVPEKPGMLARITGRIAEMGGNIIALGTMMGEDPTSGKVVIRVANLEKDRVVAAMEELNIGIQFVDARFCTSPDCGD
jgi:acetoin utilization protein AcuB